MKKCLIYWLLLPLSAILPNELNACWWWHIVVADTTITINSDISSHCQREQPVTSVHLYGPFGLHSRKLIWSSLEETGTAVTSLRIISEAAEIVVVLLSGLGSLFNLTGRKWCSFFLPHCRLFAFPHRCTRALYSSHHQTTFGRSSSLQFCSVFDGRTFSTSGRSWHSRCCRSTTCDSSFSGGRASSLPCLWWHQSMLSDWLIRSMQFQ